MVAANGGKDAGEVGWLARDRLDPSNVTDPVWSSLREADFSSKRIVIHSALRSASLLAF